MGELSAPVVVLRVTVRAPDLDAFITRYSRHIAGDRIFIFSKAPQPVGTQVRFNLQLTSGEVLIQGRGTVKRVQADGGDPRHPPGMEVQFTPLDERSATLVDFMMATRAGLTEKIGAGAAPLVRAVVPPKPKPATPVPSLPSAPSAKSKPIAIGKPASPLPPAASPAPVSPLPASPLPASSPPASPPPSPPSALPPAPSLKSKPIPVARPPSLSLESAWKSEAGEEATAVSPLPSSESAPVATAPAPPTAPPEPGFAAEAPIFALPVLEAPAAAVDSSPLALLAAGALDHPPEKPGDLATIIPPTADPSVNAPPVFAESWGGDAPANPFSDVSDGAIEYFVEWSLEQSIGPRARPQARYSDVPMVLPGDSGKFFALDPATARQRLLQLGAVFAVGALVGGLIVGLARRAPSSASRAAPLAASVEPTAAAASPPPTAPKPSAAAASAADAELTITSRPSGASVSIDGAPSGTTPVSARVAPGKHDVVLTKERYSAVTTTSDAPGKLSLDLRRPTATLHVTSTPAAADVVIAGERRGKTPVDIRLPGYESYDVRVALAGAKPWRKTVYLSHAQNRVDAALATPPRAGRR